MRTSDRIRHYREKAGLTQRGLESLTEISQSTINRIESGRRPVKPYELTAIAEALGCPESSLVEHHEVRDRIQWTARTNSTAVPDPSTAKDFLFYLLEMDTYLRGVLQPIESS
ncbi:transcriptional regulator with XRE-family HTH domain [Arthrobacter sp. UYCu511]|uniref:helix-turn-helix domain-containing protein n=1 Tax=Arthrobacter sp. UYCu511 TaxID=3156337 RepID=UPI00339A634C